MRLRYPRAQRVRCSPSSRSANWALYVFVVICLAANPLFFPEEVLSPVAQTNTEMLPAITLAVPISTVFPAADQVSMTGDSQLALTITNALGYDNPEFVDAHEHSEFHPATLSRVIQSPFHAGGNDLGEHNFSFGSNGSLELYYSDDREFVGFAATMPANLSRTTESAQYADSAVALGAALGIPGSLLAVVNVSYQNFSSISPPPNGTDWNPDLPYQGGIVRWYNRTVVVAHSSPALNLVPTGCNALGLMYDNDTGQLILVEAWRFVELPTTSSMTSDTAMETARAELPSHFYTKADVVVRDGITSIRLDTQTLRFGYQYEALLEIPNENSSYFVMLLVDVDNGMVFHSERTLPVGGWMPVVRTFPWLPLAALLILTVLIFGACILLSPEFALLFMGSYFVLLYIRLKGASILDNYNRGRIMGFISARPGASITEIRDDLRIVNGNLAYHLSVLEKLELISSSKQGRSRRFYQVGVEYSKGENHFIGRTESQILEQLGKNGPLCNAAIAGFLGMSRQRTHYNLRLLEKRGLVDRQGQLWQARLASPGPSR